jgi:hypothetical protein
VTQIFSPLTHSDREIVRIVPYSKVGCYFVQPVTAGCRHLVCADVGRLSPSFDLLWPVTRSWFAAFSWLVGDTLSDTGRGGGGVFIELAGIAYE